MGGRRYRRSRRIRVAMSAAALLRSPVMLPRFRADLKTTIAQEEDMTFIEVADPGSGVAFRFYDFEYALAQQFNGQSLDAVASWAATTYDANVTPEALQSFVDKLAGLGFLEQPGPETAPEDESAPTDPSAPPSSSSFSSAANEDDEGAVPAGPSLAGDALFEGPELVELNSSPWPARLLQSEVPDAVETAAAAPAAARAAVPVKRRSPPQLEETPIASIAHAIISEVAAESSGGGDGFHAKGGAPPSAAETFRAPKPGTPAVATAPESPVPVRPAAAPASAPGETPATNSRGKQARQGSEGPSLAPPQRSRAVAEGIATPMAGGPSAALELPKRRLPTVLAVAVIGIAIAAAVWFMWPATPATPISSGSVPAVHVMSPQPTVFHRWFSTPGVVENGRDQTLGFGSAGRIQEILPPGTTFSAGETIARLKSTAERELAVNRLRSRIAFLEQLRSSSTEAGNTAAIRDAQAKLGARNRELTVALTELAKLEIRPVLGGAVAQVLAAPGTFVAALAPVLRLRAAGPRAVFALPDDELAVARALTFCRLETLPGDPATSDTAAGGAASLPRAIDCSLPVTATPPPVTSTLARSSATAPGSTQVGDALDGKLAVDLQGGGAIAPGTPVRLASARYENVFPVPQSAILHQEGGERVWVISGAGRNAEIRAIEVASTDKGFALVSRGLRTGESVIVDPPASLRSGGEIYVAQ
jgi:hypothetical protein